MRFGPILAACIGLSALPGPAAANGGGDIVAGLIAGMIGAAVVNDSQHHNYARPAMSAAQRSANIEVQTALNFFGYAVGTPDGSIGAHTRTGIDSYQALLGDPVTGSLTEYERTILVTAYNRGMAGGPAVAQLIATDPMGVKALIVQQRNEMAGIVPAAPVAPAAQAAVTPAAPLAQTASLPNFIGSSANQVSLASACNKVSLQTNTNGGFVTVDTMKDPEFALSEQFCLARTYAMSASEDLQSKVTGFTPQQIQDQCASFGPVLKDSIAALSLRPEAEVLTAVQSFAMGSGMPPAQLAATAKICLGVGYTTDNMDVAVGSALILTALGQGAYAELLGHHLTLGFGASQRRDLALAWYDTALKAIAAGDVAVAPGLPNRTDILQKAAYLVDGSGTATAATTTTPPQPTQVALPAFTVKP